jgi:prephenate dehydrogenase
MNILVIDGMGGGIGKSVIEHIRNENADVEITAVGTNTAATSVMLKAGANYGATGENAVVYNCTKADCIIGAIGIIATNSMHGEISLKMAEAVMLSSAHKILVPVDKCGITVLGLAEKPIQAYIGEINKLLKDFS